MSGVYPNSHSVGVRHPNLSTAVWFMMKQAYFNANSHSSAGASL